jgi:type IV pilus assembly protein PilX
MRHVNSGPRQRGISLFVVMVMVLLTTLLVMGASRTALLNEMVTGNDSDYQRALEAAHAMVRDAEMDIKGEHPDGTPCVGGCRARGADASATFYPTSDSQLQDLRAALAAITPSCAAGICVPDNVHPRFWGAKANLEAMKKSASAYGAYTGAKAAETGNPLLVSGAEQRAWYWVELLPYDMTAALTGGSAEAFAPDNDTPYIYRITAVAQGLKPGTQAVVRTILVRKNARS